MKVRDRTLKMCKKQIALLEQMSSEGYFKPKADISAKVSSLATPPYLLFPTDVVPTSASVSCLGYRSMLYQKRRGKNINIMSFHSEEYKRFQSTRTK